MINTTFENKPTTIFYSGAINLGFALARNGYQVCLIDNDSQGQLSELLGLNPFGLKYTLANLMFAALDETNIEDYLGRCVLSVAEYEEGLFCIPSNKKLAGVAARWIFRMRFEATYSVKILKAYDERGL